jgi:hypothetical protein
MNDTVNFSYFSRHALQSEIISRSVSAQKISLRTNKGITHIRLTFGDNIDTIIYEVNSIFYDNFLKSFFEKMDDKIKDSLLEYILLVEEMRVNQKEYFKTRNTKVLAISKKLERQVDEETLKIVKLVREKC